jgi:glycosyl hydrolase family 25
MMDRRPESTCSCRDLLPRVLTAAALFCIPLSAHAVTYLQGIDVYTGDGAVNWNTLKTNGYTFAFVKATEGVGTPDGRFTANMIGAAAAGVYVGPYHFCRIDSKNGVPFTSYDGSPFVPGTDPYEDARTEAGNFIKAILPYYQGGSYAAGRRRRGLARLRQCDSQ